MTSEKTDLMVLQKGLTKNGLIGLQESASINKIDKALQELYKLRYEKKRRSWKNASEEKPVFDNEIVICYDGMNEFTGYYDEYEDKWFNDNGISEPFEHPYEVIAFKSYDSPQIEGRRKERK